MIDDKKIEEAARNYCNNRYPASQDAPFIAEGFRKGARWAINEFLKDLWHPYDEVPTIKDSNILQFFESYGAGSEDDFDEYFELANTREGFTQETWEEFMNEGGVPSKWLYIDDLMPKKGD